MRPSLIRSSPAIQRRTVVLPAPEGPNRTVTRDAGSTSTEARTLRPFLKVLTMCAVSNRASVEPFQYGNVIGRHAGESGDVGTRLHLVAVALEICREIAAITKVVHDVVEVRSVLKPQGM